MKEFIDGDAELNKTMEEDEYTAIFLMRDLSIELSDMLERIHACRSERMDGIRDFLIKEVKALIA